MPVFPSESIAAGLRRGPSSDCPSSDRPSSDEAPTASLPPAADPSRSTPLRVESVVLECDSDASESDAIDGRQVDLPRSAESLPLEPEPSGDIASVGDTAPVAASGGRSLFGSMFWMSMLLLILILVRSNLGSIVEEIRYGLVRGQQRAEAQWAREQLVQSPPQASAFRLVAQSVRPSVVHIQTFRPTAVDAASRSRHGALGLEDDPTDGEAPKAPPSSRSRRMEATGQGSGVIVDADGYIVTNYHVIDGANSLLVRLSDGRVTDAVQVMGVDPQSDLAVLKIDVEGIIPAEWGDSDALEVGDWVLAVGNPFGLDRSVTAGIVSATRRRNVVHSMPYQDFLQTDAAVNPGNSGGPLVDLQGHVVGITTAIVGESYQGVGFAIPSSSVRDVYQRIRSTGTVARGWLGVAMAEVESQLAGRLEIPTPGALITQVVGEPARQAGLAAGDIVVKWNDRPIESPADLASCVARAPVDSDARLQVLRGGEPLELQVRVGRREY